MFDDTTKDTIQLDDDTEQTFEHDNDTEKYYFEGGDTFTEEEYASWASSDHFFDQMYGWMCA